MSRPSGALAAVALALSAVVLVGWAVGVHGLMTLGLSDVSVRPMAAVASALLATSILIVGRGRVSRVAAGALALLAAAIGIVTAIEYATGWRSGLDTLLFPGSLSHIQETLNSLPPGRVGLSAAVGTIFLGLGTALLLTRRRAADIVAQALALCAGALSLFALIGYMLEVVSLSWIGNMSAGAALLVGVLAVALLIARPRTGLMAPFRRDTPGGSVMWRLLVPAIVALAALSYASERLHLANVYDERVELVVTMTLGIMALGAIAWLTARRLNAIDRERMIAEELARQAEVERESNRAKSEFLANMSHELRTPLNAVVGFTQLVRDGKADPVTEKQAELLGIALNNAAHLLDLIEDMLDLSLIEAGGFQPVVTQVDVSRVVDDAVDGLRLAAEKRSVSIEVDADAAAGTVATDERTLRQVVSNFLSNAIKFNQEGGTVRVRSAPEGAAGFRIEVIDAGEGISAADQARLFTVFTQLDPSTEKRAQGTGLGLALVAKLVEGMGGQVGVVSEMGRGSTFWASFPCCRAEPPPLNGGISPAPTAPPPAASHNV